jgi:hypothetical protein
MSLSFACAAAAEASCKHKLPCQKIDNPQDISILTFHVELPPSYI